MITAIIRNKENTLVLELPHSIYPRYYYHHYDADGSNTLYFQRRY